MSVCTLSRGSKIGVLGMSVALAIACGPTEPPKQQGDWTDNLKQQNPNAEPDLTGAEDEPDPAPDPAPEEPKPDTKPQPQSGRPLIQYGPKAAIESTFGVTPGSKLMLTGGMTLILPEGALDTGYNIAWKVAASTAPKHGQVSGGIAMLKINPGTSPKAKKVKSRGAAFEIRVNLGGVNLAVGEVGTDENGNDAGKPTWTVIAPARVDKAVTVGSDGEGAAETSVFQLESIGPVLYVHATTAAPG
jgi:hypothetical protein